MTWTTKKKMNTYKNQIAQSLASHSSWNTEEALALISTPPDSSKGNFSIPCFTLAKVMRKAPKIIAEDLATAIKLNAPFTKIEALNGYLNFFLDQNFVIESILLDIDTKKHQYGHHSENGKKAVIDYSSPNIGKQLAFHHLRSTMIGNCLYNSYQAAGWVTTGINHLGDWGTQFGKLIVQYLRQGYATDEATLSAIPLARLNELYVQFGQDAKTDETLEDQAREAFAKLEKKDPLNLKLWAAFKKTTLDELYKMYELMGVSFDSYHGEAFFNDHLDHVLDLLKGKNILEHSQERDVVPLEDMPPCLIRKSDGSTLYATRDIAAALYRFKTYNFDRCLYVVDNGQGLHFKQVFKVLEKCGLPWSKNLKHIPFGLILQWNESEQKWSKGSSKSGNSNTLREVFEAAQTKILGLIQAKNPDLADQENIAMQIGISALVFNDLKNKRLGDVKFDWDQALSFEGDTGPYVQNAHVRLCSIMRKANRSVSAKEVDFSQLKEPQVYELVLILSQLSGKILQVVAVNEPYILAQYSLQLAEASHRFIHHCRVIGSEAETERLFVVQCAQQVLANTLTLLDINPLRYM
jgi:arginyl-tRNA synthetase